MVREPRYIVDVYEVSPGTQPSQPSQALSNQWVEKWCKGFGGNLVEQVDPSRLSVTIRSGSLAHLPRHMGLGSGTQLAFAAAVGLSSFLGQPIPSTGEIAAVMGRAGRSAIGSYGFFQGGFLVDRGVGPGDVIAPLDLRLEFPSTWPIVLILPEHHQGLSGSSETFAFDKITPTTRSVRNKMIELVNRQIVPALASSDYPAFAKAIYQYGNWAGDHFSAIQKGPYNGPLATDLVQKIRDLGVPAAGQSSWGPCIFAIARDDEQARALTDALRDYVAQKHAGRKIQFLLTHADNAGAVTSINQTATR